jgi:hypothetical protein
MAKRLILDFFQQNCAYKLSVNFQSHSLFFILTKTPKITIFLLNVFEGQEAKEKNYLSAESASVILCRQFSGVSNML